MTEVEISCFLDQGQSSSSGFGVEADYSKGLIRQDFQAWLANQE